MPINNPHALYYDGKLIGIALNPDAYPGGIADICDYLSPHECLADAITIPQNMGNLEKWSALAKAIADLGVEEEIETMHSEEEDEEFEGAICELVTVDGEEYLVQYGEEDKQQRESTLAYLRDCGREVTTEPHKPVGPRDEPAVSWGDLSDILEPRDD
jgi:hypothetical protein